MNGSVHSFSSFLSGGSSSGSSSSLVSVLPDNPTNSQFEKYCLNVLTYLSKCVNGPDIIKYCHTEGLYCIDNSGPYNLNNVQVQCNATIVSLCPERYYCPNPYTQIACPRGHFCRLRKPRSNANTHVVGQALKSQRTMINQTTTFGLRGEL